MKVAKTYPFGFSAIFLPIILILAIVAALFHPLIHYAFYLNNVFLLLLFIVFITPFKFFQQRNQASFGTYLITFVKISLLQFWLTLLALYLHIIHTQLIPTLYAPEFVNLVDLGSSHLHDWGLFPWSAITLVGIALTFYRKKLYEHIFLINTLSSLFPKKLSGVFGVGVELFLRQGLITSVSIVAMTLGLNLYFLAVTLGFPRISFSINGYTILIFLLSLAIINNRFWESIIQNLWIRRFSILQLLWIQMLFTIGVILILIPVLTLLGENLQINLTQPFAFPIPRLPFNYAWELFSWSFWIALIVFVSTLFANIAKGKNLRVIIIFSLFWPALFAYFSMNSHLHFFLIKVVSALNYTLLSVGITIVCTILLSLYFWLNKSFEPLLFHSYYCQSTHTKNYLPIKTVIKILRFMSLFLLIYVFDGINMLSIIFFGLVATCFATYFLIGLSLIKSFWCQNDNTISH